MAVADGPAADEYDLIVIGGGINGAGIARDAGKRGIRTLLLEANDYGSGTSSWSTRLIHGGLRYLEYAELALVRESLLERRRLQRQAPHLIRPICLTIPVYRSARRGRFLIRLGLIAYDLLSLGKELPRHRMLSRKELMAAEPGLCSEGLTGGARYYDAQVSYAERLVLENVLSAREHGVVVRNYAPVTELRRLPDGRHEVGFVERGGEPSKAVAGIVVNATGPWVDRLLALAEHPFPRLMGGTKGSHVVAGAFPGAPRHAIYVEAGSDGRPIFIVPWNDQYLIGTTDIRFEGDPADARASDEEIRYLLGETNRVFPDAALTENDLHFAYSGVRPLPWQAEGPESAITRSHLIVQHDEVADGLISIVGGKLTTYRSLAEETVDVVAGRLDRSFADCRTRNDALPGAGGFDTALGVSERIGTVAPGGRKRLLGIYGGRVRRLLSLCEADPSLARTLDRDEGVLAAEVALAVREEEARTLVDIVHRRLMIGLSARLGADLIDRVSRLAATELGWDEPARSEELERLAGYHRRLRRRH